jgi:tyrosine-protein kinase Etk/Wzc
MTNPPPNEASVMGLLRVIHRWRRLVLAFALGLPVLTAIVVVCMPNHYTAQGTILLEIDEGQGGLEMLGQLSSLAGLAGLPTTAPSTGAYLAILKSRRVGAAVIDSLGLSERYRIRAVEPGERTEKTLLKLEKRVKILSPDPATLSVSATDKDPALAAAIVNAYLQQLRDAKETLSFTRARQTRQMVEEGLRQTEAQLEESRRAMTDFQTRYGVFSLDDQTRGTLGLIAELQGKLLEAQTERDALAGIYQPTSTRIRTLQSGIEALQTRVQGLVGQLGAQAEHSAAPPSAPGDYVLPLSRIPELAGTYAKLTMDLKVLETKYGVLAGRLEQTRIDESQSVPTFEVLDHAVPPFRKSGPHRTLFVAAAFLGGLLAGVLLAVLLDDLSHRMDEGTRRELRAMLPARWR